MFPVALSLGGMLMRVAALAVVPRVIRALSRTTQAEAQLPAPAELEQPLKKPEPVVTSPSKPQKTPARRWTITRSVKRESPILWGWWAPTCSRGPPSHFGGTRSWAYLHRRSFPINNVDPSGLEVDATLNVSAGTLTVVDYGSGSVGTGRPVSTTVFNVFSGQGRGLNNPNRDGVPDIGPLPRGEYVIGPMEDVGGARPELSGDTMWFPILDGQTLKNKKALQNQETGKDNERNGFYIHPGLVSDGCITFKSDVPKGTDKGKGGYPRSADYTNLKSILNSTGAGTYSYQSGRVSRTVFSSGRLHVR